MIKGSTSRLSLFAALMLSLAACSSSSNPDPTGANEDASGEPEASLPADSPTNPEPDNSATPPTTAEDPDNEPVVVTEAPPSDPVNTPDDAGAPSPGDDVQDPPSVNLTPPPAPGANPDNQPPEQSVEDPAQGPPDDGTEPVEAPSDSSDPVEPPDESNPPLIGGPPAPGGLPVVDNPPATDTTPLVPPVTPGGDLDQLIRGLSEEASAAILFLNAQIAQGSVSAEQNDCLGAYEPGLGSQLTSFDCGNLYLERDSNRMFLTQAALFDTAECQASLFNANSEACVLEKLSMTVPADWSEAPSLGYPGAEVNFAIGDTSLRIESDSQALSGVFACEINLETAASVSVGNAISCDTIVSLLVDEIDRLQGR